MAARRQHIEDEDADINLTPMLDVTFILLIFFIVTSTFIKIPGVEVDKIEADNATPLKAPIVIAIDESDAVWIDRKKLDQREIYASVQGLIEDNPGARAMIQVDAESRSGTLLEVMETMMEAGMVKIDVVTDSKNP